MRLKLSTKTKKWKKNLKGLWRNFAESSFAAVLIAVLFSLAGLIGSLYSNEIKNTCPFSLLDTTNLACSQGEISLNAASFFWLSLVLGATLLARRTIKLKNRLDNTIVTLRNDIETAPSDDFMEVLKTHFEDATSLSIYGCSLADEKLKDNKLESKHRETQARAILESEIQKVLDFMAILLRKIDKKPNETYRSNIMIWVPLEEKFKGTSAEELAKKSVFGTKLNPTFFSCGGIEDLSGILVGIQSLSTKTDKEGYDDTFPDGLTLPVPKERTSANGHLNALLGAPLAFIDEKEYSLVTDSSDLSEWFQQSNYPYQIKDELNAFFKNGGGNHVGSFVSYKLTNIDDIELGVVNFDRTSTGMLKDRKSPLYFQTILAIFAPLLANLLSKWIETH